MVFSMNDKVFLSIIVPVYNVVDYLEECIASICNQSFKDFEVILVDDGSTDGSGHLCDILAETRTNFQVIHSDNQGLAKARNLGIDYSRGEYLGFVDSDDAIHPKMYEILAEEAIQSGSDTVSCSYCTFENRLPHIEEMKVAFKRLSAKEAVDHFWSDVFLKIGIPQWSSIYRSSMFKNFKVCTLYRYYEDLNTLPDLLQYSRHFSYTDSPLYFYRLSESSILRSPINQDKIDRLGSWKNCIIPFLEKHCDQDSIQKGYNTYIDWYEIIARMICESSDKSLYINKEYKRYLFRLVKGKGYLKLRANKKSIWMFISYFLLMTNIRVWYQFINRNR